MELDEDLDEERVMVARETYLRASRAEQQGQLAEAVTLYKEAYRGDPGLRYYGGDVLNVRGFDYSIATGEPLAVSPSPPPSLGGAAIKPSEVGEQVLTNASAKDFKIHLVDLQLPLCEHFRKQFAPFGDKVSVTHGKFEALPQWDCMVSAANSFGLMDGGVDAAITLYFGDQLQKRVQRYILDHFDGEQPIGTSFIIGTGNPAHPYIAHTPTMRVPYSIRGTDYVYLAFKAMLTAVRDHNVLALQQAAASSTSSTASEPTLRPIRSVACTGLGTFYGKMALDEAARQMALAFKNFLTPPQSISWNFATQRQYEVGFGGEAGFRKIADKEEGAEVQQSRRAIQQQMSELSEATEGLNH